MPYFSSELSFEKVLASDVEAIIDLEIVSYPADEAATPEKIRYRAETASDFFLVTKKDTEVIGFINGTCIKGKTITHDSMSKHDSSGKTVVIHSVVTHLSHRRQGLASWMLLQYLQHLYANKLVDDVLLLSKPYLMPLYMSAGFQFRKVSDVVHGQETWVELGLNLKEHFGVDQWQVDAFTDRPFGGNPAAVVLVHKEESWMQSVALENNLSETCFLKQLAENRFLLRWFTPASEVALCGHATLAGAHTLQENGLVSLDKPVVFETLYSGELTATYQTGGRIQLSFPATPISPYAITSEERVYLHQAFSILDEDIVFVGKSLYDLVVEMTPSAFHNLSSIQYSILRNFGGRGVVITCAGVPLGGSVEGKTVDSRFDFFSRCFFPLLDINEDAVCGSAHCGFCPYWMEKYLAADIPKESLIGMQNSPRGGTVEVRLEGDRVLLSGTAVTTLKSKILA